MHSVTPETGEAVKEAASNTYITKHFRYSDLACPCCDQLKLIPGLYRHMELLEELMRRVGFGVIVTSGYRCASHNRAVGGSLKSWHMIFATDIAPADGDSAKVSVIEAAAREMPFGGIGLYRRHVHVDIRPVRTLWRV